MSIRKKLLLSYLAMIVVPITVFALTAAVGFSLFINYSNGSPLFKLPEHFNTMNKFVNRMKDTSDWSSGLAFIARQEPEQLEDPGFLSQTEQGLKPLDMGLTVERGGKIVYSSPWLEGGAGLQPGRLEQMPDNRTHGPPRNSSSLQLGSETYTVTKTPFQPPGGGDGTVYVLEKDRISRLGRFVFLGVLLFIVLVVGLTNGLLTYLVSKSIIRPLYRLKAAAEQIAEGNLDHELKLGSKDEIGQLSVSFEEMRIRLRASIHAQLQQEENRKELLSNISHDLKTPITAISACAEGMRDGIADTPEKLSRYIAMIHDKATHMDSLDRKSVV